MAVPTVALLAALGFAACGSEGSKRGVATSTRPRAPERSTGRADPAATRVIRGWSDAERASEIEKASSYFTLPSVVENGTGAIELRTRSEVRAFNSSLPCGARLIRSARAGSYTVATFRLTERPGGRCDGVGAEARTAFRIEGGRIKAWLRLPEPPGGRPPASPRGEPPSSV